ncbi:hypothetical protein PC9H_006934 [Pleurotus ostreatus]|uniref:Uncharacterized protein n=2 Tax=Pleurotus TaxID=5320 RepID=A0A8H6ZX54_PLEOS|nr:uncharacterized protein PC9H_006934 [Pleurotus ostreatus]KAF7431213.1 hypothetical protein PC9H_006934 [Pleurotus ostreatus]KAG9224356.1 hypothetical protein CCMSSC00406_0007870 [Pleurotus cornucopiae]KAJ8695676.1 hypothetical protein PTI98_008249 [Pleurotus ostreatus]
MFKSFIIIYAIAALAGAQDAPVFTADRVVNKVVDEAPFLTVSTEFITWTQSPSIIESDVSTTSATVSVGF